MQNFKKQIINNTVFILKNKQQFQFSVYFKDIQQQGLHILNNKDNLQATEEANLLKKLYQNIQKETIIFEENYDNLKLQNENQNVYNYPQNMNVTDSFEVFNAQKQFEKENKLPQSLFLIHQLAHIEYNAMKTYLDTSIRFPYQIIDINEQNQEIIQNQMEKFVKEGLKVAYDEARHFLLLEKRLQADNLQYGFFPVINQIRKNSMDTVNLLSHRVALTSIIQEGRGVDAGSRLLQKLINFDDKEGLNALKIILREEVDHIKFGRKYFELSCINQNKQQIQDESDKQNFDIHQQFIKIADKYDYKYRASKQFNRSARIKAGFDEQWFKKVFQTPFSLKKNQNK